MRRDGDSETSIATIPAPSALESSIKAEVVIHDSGSSNRRTSFDATEFDQRVAKHRGQLKYQPMVIVLVSVALGISFDRILDFQFWVYIGISGASFTAYLLTSRIGLHQWPLDWQGVARATLLLISFAALGSGWQHGRWNWFANNEIGLLATELPTPVCLEGQLASEPRLIAKEENSALNPIPQRDRTRILFYPKRIRLEEGWQTVNGRMDLVVHQDASQFRSGDTIQVIGRLAKIQRPTNPGQMDFSRLYREKQKLAVMHAFSNESIRLIRRQNWGPDAWVSGLRRKFNEMIWKYVGSDRAGLASAILLGNREQLTSDRRELFMVTGTVHLLAISGLHVGILAGAFFLFYRMGLVGRKRFLWATICFVLFYTWLVEFRPPVSRAAILIVLVCLGRLLGRRSLTFNWLAIAGLVVLIINPSDLFRLGPQLSFLAVATIIFGKDWMFWPRSNDPIDRLIANSRPFHLRTCVWFGRKLRAAIMVSALIWLIGMPLVASRFHLLAPVSLIVNPLLLIPVALALYCGMGVMIFGWLFPPLAQLCGRLCSWNLNVVEGVIGWAEQIPIGYTWTAGPTGWAVILFYLLLFLLAVYPPTRQKWPLCLAAAAAWFVFAWSVPDRCTEIVKRTQNGELECTFVDVGHGTAVIIQTPSGKTVLYDSGRMGSVKYGVNNISSVLWHKRVSNIDAVFVSHADVDHFNALPELAKRFGIGCVYVSSVMQQNKSGAVQVLFDALERNGIPLKTINAPQRFEIDETTLQLLSPPKLGTEDTDNSNSLVLMVRCHNHRLLLSGDLERNGMEYLLGQSPEDCDVAMAPHHGSKNSRPQQFAAWANPEFMIISASARKIDEQVTNEWAADGIEVFSTGSNGAIRVSFAGHGISIQSWTQGDWN